MNTMQIIIDVTEENKAELYSRMDDIKKFNRHELNSNDIDLLDIEYMDSILDFQEWFNAKINRYMNSRSIQAVPTEWLVFAIPEDN